MGLEVTQLTGRVGDHLSAAEAGREEVGKGHDVNFGRSVARHSGHSPAALLHAEAVQLAGVSDHGVLTSEVSGRSASSANDVTDPAKKAPRSRLTDADIR